MAAVNQKNDPILVATSVTLCHFFRRYCRSLRTWGFIGFLLMLAHWAVYVLFGAATAKRIGIDTTLADAAGVGSFLVLAYVVALALWAIHAICHWRVLRSPARRITRWIAETTIAAAALFSGIAVVALLPAFKYHDQVARLLLFYTAILLVMLVVMNWLLALVRSFSRDKQGGAMSALVLAALAVDIGMWICIQMHSRMQRLQGNPGAELRFRI
jgi:hypothetical protein